MYSILIQFTNDHQNNSQHQSTKFNSQRKSNINQIHIHYTHAFTYIILTERDIEKPEREIEIGGCLIKETEEFWKKRNCTRIPDQPGNQYQIGIWYESGNSNLLSNYIYNL